MRIRRIELHAAPSRRRLLPAAAAAALPVWAVVRTLPKSRLVEGWKGPVCGCCEARMNHLEANGFQVKARDTCNNDVRASLGIPVKYGSRHTALVSGYAIEGHVPAREIHRLLMKRPHAVGLAVPGMSLGSPGTNTPAYGGRKCLYDVLLVRKDGSTTIYQAHS